MARIAVFIDGAYLEYLLKEEFGAPQIDFKLLVETTTEGCDTSRSE